MTCRVERERKIGTQGPVGPTGDLLSSASIDHRNLVRVGDVDKDTLPGRLEAETLGVSLEADVRNLAAACRIDDGECTTAVPHPNLVGCLVDTHVVGVLPELDPADRREAGTLKESYRAVRGVGDIQRIGRGHVADTLRLLETGEPERDAVLLEVDHTDRVIAELRDKQPLSIQIDSQVVNATPDVA